MAELPQPRFEPESVSRAVQILSRLSTKNRRLATAIAAQALAPFFTGTGDIAPDVINPLLALYQLLSEKDQPNGYPSLDGDGYVPDAEISPDIMRDAELATALLDYILKSIIDAKGDLIVGTADNTPARLPVGLNGQVPTADSTATTGIRWAVPSSIPSSAQGTWLVSGGQVIWIANYDYLVAAGSGYIDGVLVTWAQQTITLDAADPTLDRIDVIGVDNTGTVFKITGDPATNPSEPVVDPSTQLKLALVTVAGGSTQPTTVTTELIYADNAGDPPEWNWTTSGSGFTLGSTSNPRTGTTDIEGTSVATSAYAQAQPAFGVFDPNDYDNIVLYLRFKAAWNANRYLQITLRNAGVQIGNALRISGGFFGLDGTNTTSYQAVIIPLLQFAVPAGSMFDQIRIQAIGSGGAAIGFYLDDISMQTGGASNVGGGMTQADADARYLQRANNLTDVTDVVIARASLGLNQLTIQEIDGSPTELEPVRLEFPNGTLTEPSAGVVRYTPTAPTVDTDEKAKVSSNDTTAGYLNGKLVAGANITLTENNDGSNETLTIAAAGSGDALDVTQLHEHVINEDLTAETDSSKTTFVLANEAEPETTAVYLAGARLHLGTDYSEAATYDAITFGVAPTAGAVLVVDYVAA